MYGLWMAAGLAAFALALIWQTDNPQKQAGAAVAAALLAMVGGLVFAKAGYVLLMLQSTLFSDGLAAFFSTKANHFSYVFGAAGAFGGIWLSARLFKLPVSRWLNSCAPCTALLIAFLRAGEKTLGTIGAGRYVPEGSVFARFPFAVANSYGEHLYAVFYLEALFALAAAVVLLCCRKEKWFSRRAELSAFLLALPQVLCESLRARCMRWGFVRVEQLLCAVVMLGLLIHACTRLKGSPLRRFWRAGAAVLLIAGIGLLEYALDKTDLPVPVCYLLMAAALAAFGVLQWQAMNHQLKKS